MRRLFTEEEDALLRKHYSRLGATEFTSTYLPSRPLNAVRSRAQKLGIVQRRPNYKRKTTPKVTVAEPTPIQFDFSISESLAKLAAFDPLFARVAQEKRFGLPPLSLRRDAK